MYLKCHDTNETFQFHLLLLLFACVLLSYAQQRRNTFDLCVLDINISETIFAFNSILIKVKIVLKILLVNQLN